MDNDRACAFGQWLNAKRQASRLTLRRVEQLTRQSGQKGMSHTHLCHIETGRRDPLTISPRILRLLAGVYDVSILEILQRAGVYEGFQLSLDDLEPPRR